jgi:hypothetical protein
VIVNREIADREPGALNCAGHHGVLHNQEHEAMKSSSPSGLNTLITHKCRAAIFPPLAIVWRIVIGNRCFPGRRLPKVLRRFTETYY